MKIKPVLLTTVLLAIGLVGLAQTTPIAPNAVLKNSLAADATDAINSNQSEATEIKGQLQVGKTQSVILYVGMESGDYAAYCFANNSVVGRKILAACKNRQQCAVTGVVEDHNCKVPGLEADLSASFRITTVQSVKSVGGKRGSRK